MRVATIRGRGSGRSRHLTAPRPSSYWRGRGNAGRQPRGELGTPFRQNPAFRTATLACELVAQCEESLSAAGSAVLASGFEISSSVLISKSLCPHFPQVPLHS